MKNLRSLSVLFVVLAVFMVFTACDSTTSGLKTEVAVPTGLAVTASTLKSSGAITFLDLEDEGALGAFFESFENDAKLRKLFGDSENEGTLSEMLESDEVFGDIKKFVESIM